MFPDLDPYQVPLELIDELAGRMVEADGADLDHPDLPAGYTYLGQFLNHDLTFDPVSNLWVPNDPRQLEDFRTPRLDLDAVYGSGPRDMPYLY
ncbi:MAG TPA: peroxidase, partial [Actinomycetes bacterium]|nr:peroxidase [Actinomycetes bacterium]